jgi:signal peptidase II
MKQLKTRRNRLKKHIRDYIFLFLLSGTIIALDQWTKDLVRTQLAFAETWTPWDWLAPYARIVNWHNTGSAFGMFQGYSIIFTALAILVAGAIIFYFPQVPREEWPLRIALGLQLGGAVGNLIDRLTRGFVTDFVSLGRFPVFNVADSSISLGVVVLLIGMWITERKLKTHSKPEGDSFSDNEHALTGEEFQGE